MPMRLAFLALCRRQARQTHLDQVRQEDVVSFPPTSRHFSRGSIWAEPPCHGQLTPVKDCYGRTRKSLRVESLTNRDLRE